MHERARLTLHAGFNLNVNYWGSQRSGANGQALLIHSFKEKGEKRRSKWRESETGGERAGAETKSVCSYLHFIVRGAQITHTAHIAPECMHVTTQKQGGLCSNAGVDTCERDAKWWLHPLKSVMFNLGESRRARSCDVAGLITKWEERTWGAIYVLCPDPKADYTLNILSPPPRIRRGGTKGLQHSNNGAHSQIYAEVRAFSLSSRVQRERTHIPALAPFGWASLWAPRELALITHPLSLSNYLSWSYAVPKCNWTREGNSQQMRLSSSIWKLSHKILAVCESRVRKFSFWILSYR